MKKQLDTRRRLYTLCILVRDIPGVLSQVARLFSRKGYNIESIVSGETDRPGITRITIGILADQGMIEQIAAQCSKLLPVTAVKILDEDTSIRREIALVKVGAADRNARDEVIQLANIFRAKVIRRQPGIPDVGDLRQQQQDHGADRDADGLRHPGNRKDRYYRNRKRA